MAASERGTGTTDNGGASDAPNAPGARGATGARGGRLSGLGRSAGAGRSNRTAKDTRNTGPGRLLIAVYAIFALSATARAGYQILTKFSEAPLAYLLSAFAAVGYIVATISLAKPGRTAFKVSV